MEKQGYITPDEHAAALNDNVYDRIREYDASYEESSVYTYYEDALIDQVISFLTEEKGYSSDQAHRMVYSGGLCITSAQDADIQKICDQEFANEANFPAGTKYGIDYALSVSDENGIVTHYGQEDLRRYVRENHDASFNLMCQDPETAQKYADAFRESVLASYAEKSLPADDSSTDSPCEVLGERLTLSPQPQASVVIIDQSTGFVRAVVGGRGEKTASLTLNRATATTRQPGSTFKILTAYAPALDACGQTLATLYENEPYEYEDGTPVSNWDLNDYSGPTSIREAIIRSVNVVAVKCITEVTPQLGFQYAKKLGISTLHENYESNGNYSSDIVQPLALGGITQGVSNLELCSAYAAIANDGIRHEPRFFTRILDRNGNTIVDYTASSLSDSGQSVLTADKNSPAGGSVSLADSSNPADSSSLADGSAPTDSGGGTRVLKSSTAWLLTDAMRGVVSNENGTAYGMISAGAIPVAGKTGTTSSYKDIWFVGYTPYYTCCVWGGYDNNESLPDGSTFHTYNKTLWTSIMTRIHASLPAREFPSSKEIVTVTLCKESGLPAVPDGCQDTWEESFCKGTEPTGACPLHKPAARTKPALIYQDILDKLLPETETKDLPMPETDSLSDPEKDLLEDIGTDSFPDIEDTLIADGVPGQDAEDPLSSDQSLLDTKNQLSSDPNLSDTEKSLSSDLNLSDTETSPDSDTAAPSATENSLESPSGQPQTTSLDDMIDQLSRYGLP